MSDTKTHGGERKGAGRPPVDTVEHRVRLPRDVVSLLTALGGDRLSKGIIMAANDLPLVNPEPLAASRTSVEIGEYRVRLPRDVGSRLRALGGRRLSRGIIRAADALRIGNEKAAEG